MSATTTLKAVLLGQDVSMSRTIKGAGKEADTTKRRLGNLRGELKNLGKGSGSLKGVMGGAFKDIGGAASSLGMAGGPIGMVGGAVVALGALGASVLVPFAKEAVGAFKEVAGEVAGLKRVMGGTAEEASHFRFSLEEVGLGADVGQKAVGIFSKKLDAAKGSAKAHTKMVKDLGFEYLDAHGKILPMNDLLPKVADRFARMPDGPEKTALAMKLFGKAGAQLIPMLNKGAKGMAEAAKKSDEFGLTLSGKNLQALKDSKVAQRDMSAAVLGLKVRFGAELLPMLTKVVLWFTSKVIPVLVRAGKWWESHSKEIGMVAKAIGVFIGALWKILSTYFKLWFKAIQIIGNAFIWLWNNAIQPALKFIIGGIASLMHMWAGMLRALGNVPGFGWAKDAAVKMKGAADKAEGIANAIKKIPTKKDVTIFIHTSGGRIRLPDGTYYNVGQRAGGGPTAAGRTYLVGENGPELWSESRSGHVTPFRQTAAMLKGGGGGAAAVAGGYDGPDTINLVIDGKVVHQVLLRQKRLQGPLNLG